MRCKRVVLSDISTLCLTAAAKDLTYMRQDRVRQSIYAYLRMRDARTHLEVNLLRCGM